MVPAAGESVMIVTGEASGDLHGARVAAGILSRAQGIHMFGIGGDRLKATGVELIIHSDTLSVMGISEVLGRLAAIRSGLATARRLLREKRPDLVILIDFPDFNLRVAAEAKRLKIPVLYYISPKIWAWRQKRVRKIRKLTDHMAVILPFEKSFYDQYAVPSTFVGNPVLDIPAYRNPEVFQKHASGHFTVGLLPGSREMEMKRHLPVLLDSAKLLHHRRDSTRFVLSLIPALRKAPYLEMIEAARWEVPLEVTSAPVEAVFRRCHALVAASGTVTLEAAVCGCPMVVIYKVSRLSYWVGKAMIRVPFISLVNLIAGGEVVPELIQERAEPAGIVRELLRLADHPDQLEDMRSKLLKVRHKLGNPGASDRVAKIALGMIEARIGR